MKGLNLQIVERVVSAFRKGESSDEAQGAESGGSRETESGSDASPTLYKCSKCETTYISEEMESCPECGSAVDRRPSAAELGIRSSTH